MNENIQQQQDDDGQEIKTIRLVGDIILDRQKTLLGHLLRRDDSDLMRHVAFDENLKRPYQLYKKTGHPNREPHFSILCEEFNGRFVTL